MTSHNKGIANITVLACHESDHNFLAVCAAAMCAARHSRQVYLRLGGSARDWTR